MTAALPLTPDAAASADEAATADSAPTALDLLLHRMRLRTDFPSLSGSVLRIQRIAASDTESVASLASEILKDVALTHKLLRIVNTVHFARAGGGNISTVSRAVALVGFAGIRNTALSLMLLEGMQDKAQAGRLREEFLRSLLAAHLAHTLTPGDAEAEEAYLAALFHNLGRLLAEFYLPEEAASIRRLCQTSAGTATALSPDAAARQVLGLGFEALAVGVAKTWGLPESLRVALRRPEGRVPTKVVPRGSERTRLLAAMAHDMAQAMQGGDVEEARQVVRRMAEQHAVALDTSAASICMAADGARQTVARLVPALGLSVPAGSATDRLLNFSSSADAAPVAVAASSTAGMTAPLHEPGQAQVQDSHEAAAMLAAGIQDVMTTLAGDSPQPGAVLRMILETLLRALQLRRVVFCLRDPRTQRLTGRFGLGADAEAVVRRFDIDGKPPAGAPIDLFSAVCLKAVDTVIANAGEAAIRQRLPPWYGADIASPSFLLLPLAMKGATFGLIYADAAHTGALVLAEPVMAQVRTLRNQAVMAFRPSA